jgi:GTPase SAR1 family protein
VYDITKKDSFTSIKNWLSEVKNYAEPDLTVIAIGNKVDLEEERQVTTEAGQEFAKKNEVFFMEVSALENFDDCVSKAFRLLVEGKTSKLIFIYYTTYFFQFS